MKAKLKQKLTGSKGNIPVIEMKSVNRMETTKTKYNFNNLGTFRAKGTIFFSLFSLESRRPERIAESN